MLRVLTAFMLTLVTMLGACSGDDPEATTPGSDVIATVFIDQEEVAVGDIISVGARRGPAVRDDDTIVLLITEPSGKVNREPILSPFESSGGFPYPIEQAGTWTIIGCLVDDDDNVTETCTDELSFDATA